ncbi:MAG: tetratricopeptide repeat protein, partial [Acidobacteria bacterium]|nr:tetratricopeptide repeat protein [Acidobacteriota bacterium]
MVSIGRRVALVIAAVSAVLVTGAQGRRAGDDAELQFQLATLLFEETRFEEAIEAFHLAAGAADPQVALRARMGMVRSALRIGDFDRAQREASTLRDVAPRDPEAIAVHADALWSAGLFDEAEREWRDALAIAPDLSRGRHGLARGLASSGRLEQAVDEAAAALKLAPRDGEIHHTLGAIYERLGRFEQAAASYSNYVNLLPNKDRSEKAAWSRSQIRFLRSFGERQPMAIDEISRGRLHTVDFKVEDEKVLVKVRVNGNRWQDFVLDTGSELTTISRQTASSAGVRPITYTLSAGVGEVG